MTRMARAGCYVLLLFAGMAAGCGSSSLTDATGPPPPHGGTLFRLPEGKGFVEVVKKEAGASKENITGEASFYFLNKDGTTPYSAGPTTGSLTVGKTKVTLKSEGDALVTPSGPALFPKGGVDGALTFELDGKTVTIPLGLR